MTKRSCNYVDCRRKVLLEGAIASSNDRTPGGQGHAGWLPSAFWRGTLCTDSKAISSLPRADFLWEGFWGSLGCFQVVSGSLPLLGACTVRNRLQVPAVSTARTLDVRVQERGSVLGTALQDSAA